MYARVSIACGEKGNPRVFRSQPLPLPLKPLTLHQGLRGYPSQGWGSVRGRGVKVTLGVYPQGFS